MGPHKEFLSNQKIIENTCIVGTQFFVIPPEKYPKILPNNNESYCNTLKVKHRSRSRFEGKSVSFTAFHTKKKS